MLRKVSCSRQAVILAACVAVSCQPVPEVEPVPRANPPAIEAPPPKPSIDFAKGTKEMIDQMYGLYRGIWYRTLRFTQTNTIYMAGGKEITSRWEEHIAVPGRLRIDFLPLSDKSGMLIDDDDVMTFAAGKRTGRSKSIHPLLLLTVDVYAINPAVTLRRLDSLGVNRARFRVTEWEGRPTYVVGAVEMDTTSTQFWVDAERLLLVRWVKQEKRGKTTVLTDTRVKAYKDVEGIPIPQEILVLHGGKPYFRERYDSVALNVPYVAKMFEPAKWSTARVSVR
jgi:hypothetical protein